jgi:hypothetical protein
MLHRVALVTTDVSDKPSASIFRVTRIGELGTALAVTSKPTHAAKKYEVRNLKCYNSCGVCDGQSDTGAGFLPALRFPLPLIHPTNFSTLIIIYHPGLVKYANKWLK